MAHYQPRKFRRRGNDCMRIVTLYPAFVTYPSLPAARKSWKEFLMHLSSWFL